MTAIDREQMSRENRTDQVWRVLEMLFVCFLICYPMRHIAWGGDLWDVGYNYGNFRFGNMQSMGKMWFFSTYLSNAVGHFLTILPWGHTVLGLNLYTGLFAGGLAVMGYFFCTLTLHIPKILVFVGEWIALSLCWCPTALLYNYITYVLFTLCAILLYHGLIKDDKLRLVLAGVCLGSNVFVRFSNLPEMGLILAVWFYDLLQGWEEKQSEGAHWLKNALLKMLWDTMLCLAGYLMAAIVFLGWIGVRYGLSQYAEGIRLLFAMTDHATDYKPASMLYGLIWPFKEGLYWVKRILIFAVAAVAVYAGMDFVISVVGKNKKTGSVLRLLSCFGLAVAFAFWLFLQRKDPAPNLTDFYYTSYSPIYWPGALFLMMVLGVGAIDVVRRNAHREERFWGMTMILIVILTSLGSNNGLFPSYNHLFLAAPYVLWRVYCFTIWSLKKSTIKATKISFVPISVLLWVFLLVCSIQFGMFGAFFSFYEGTGMQEKSSKVESSIPLRGIGMGAERAKWLEEISQYAREAQLTGRRAILHGKIPALSFYLEMPPAFHSWNDLKSFQPETMKQTLADLMTEIDKGGEKPVIIADQSCLEEGQEDEKWEMILDFMGRYQYKRTFENEKFVIWE